MESLCQSHLITTRRMHPEIRQRNAKRCHFFFFWSLRYNMELSKYKDSDWIVDIGKKEEENTSIYVLHHTYCEDQCLINCNNIIKTSHNFLFYSLNLQLRTWPNSMHALFWEKASSITRHLRWLQLDSNLILERENIDRQTRLHIDMIPRPSPSTR